MHVRTHEPRDHNPPRQIRDLLMRILGPKVICFSYISNEIPVDQDTAVEDYLAGWIHGHECCVGVEHCFAVLVGLWELEAGLRSRVDRRKQMLGK